MPGEWFTIAEIAAAAGADLPATVRGLNMVALKWRHQAGKARKRPGRGGGWEYHVTLLPAAVQARLALAAMPTPENPERNALWARFEGLSKAHKATCETRLAIILDAEQLARGGLTETAAARVAARKAGVSVASLFNWRRALRGLDRCDWLPALAPKYETDREDRQAECHPLAWDALVSDWLRPGEPKFSACYRRIAEAAKKHGWTPIPAERTLRRRIEREIPRGVAVLARKGRDKARTLYPAQERSRAHFHAMEAVNADGHKLDVFVRFSDGRVGRANLMALQDLYSGMIVAWRLSETENKETVRLAIGDMVERYGIPEKCWLDNGRGFASKWITGGTETRYRFKVRDGDPQGLLTTLQVETHWTKPYSGQSKPIERAFRDLAEEISKHPFCDGAYTGNRPDAKPENYGNAAIPIEAFRAFIGDRIAAHNDRSGRRTETARGRSFRETFEESYASATVRWPTEAQKSLWLLAAEKVRTAKGSGEIRFFDNRYWAPELNGHAGREVVVRFDPDRLHDGIRIYGLDDRLICEAACIAATGFDDADAARTHNRDRAAYQKALAEQLRLTRKLSADELARLYGSREAEPVKPAKPGVKRIATARGGAAAQQESDFDFDAAFARGLDLLERQAEVIPFKPSEKSAA